MTLPASGAISLNAVNVELGLPGTTTISMNNSVVRTLFGKASGAISMSDGYSKQYRTTITYTFAANIANATLNVTSGTAPAGGSVSGTYVAGKTDVSIIVNSGVYVYSTSTSTPGLTLSGGVSGDTVTLTNNGYILGQGGTGGGSAGSTSTYAAPVNGTAGLRAGFNMSVVNNTGAFIAGGGGGGGGGASVSAGGGAGGGAGGSAYNASFTPSFYAGGTGGGLNGSGGNGTTASPSLGTGGGGGRVIISPSGTGGAGGSVAGSTSPFQAAGLGGGSGGGGSSYSYGNAGGMGGGGGWGASGGTGIFYTNAAPSGTTVRGGAGGSAGANGGTGSTTPLPLTQSSTAAGATGGKAINFNGFSVTISGAGTTYGATS